MEVDPKLVADVPADFVVEDLRVDPRPDADERVVAVPDSEQENAPAVVVEGKRMLRDNPPAACVPCSTREGSAFAGPSRKRTMGLEPTTLSLGS
jgi:hypothetical protein